MSQLQQFTNNASGTLNAGITNVATTAVLGSAQGTLFPTLTGGQFFMGTLKSVSTGLLEIVKVTARSSDTLTIIRGQEGTSASTFVTGDIFELRPTAQAFGNIYTQSAQLDGAAFTGAVSMGSTLSVTGISTLGVITTTSATVPTVSLADNSTNAASTAFVKGQNFAPLASPALTGTPTAPTASPGTNTTQVATTAFTQAAITAASTIPISVRHAIQFGPTTSTPAVSALIPASQIGNTLATGVTLKHSTAPTLYSVANGFNANGSANNINFRATVDITIPNLTASSTNYIFVDTVAQTAGFVIVADSDQSGGTIPVTNNQYTFDYNAMVNFLGNGTTASQTNRIIVAEVDTNGTVVIAIRCRAYKREFEGSFVTPLPAASTFLIQNSNLGTVNKVFSYLEAECITADVGYSPGDRVQAISGYNGTYSNPNNILNKKNTTVFLAGNGSPAWILTNNSTGSATPLTSANWKLRFIAQSNWGRS